LSRISHYLVRGLFKRRNHHHAGAAPGRTSCFRQIPGTI
jgi:hypothetical protein